MDGKVGKQAQPSDVLFRTGSGSTDQNADAVSYGEWPNEISREAPSGYFPKATSATPISGLL